MIYFDEIDIAVKPKGATSHSGILANSCSLSISNSAQETYTLGRRGSLGARPAGPAQASINFSYLLETESEPCFEVVRLLKNQHLNNAETAKCNISFAGTTGTFYLSNYSFSSSPNSSITANASFACFDLITGKNLGKFSRNNSQINYNTTRSIAHGWSTYLIESGNHPKKNPTLGFSYAFMAKHEPSYVLGNQVPSQVDYLAGKESISVLKTELYNAHVSGITGQQANLANSGSFSGDANFAPVLLDCNNSMNDSTFQVNLSGHHITQTTVSSRVSDIVTTKIDTVKYF